MPARVYCADAAGPHGDITWLAGPWRSSGDWWNPAAPNGNPPVREARRNPDRNPDAPAWSREEWDVRVAESSSSHAKGQHAALYRLVRDAETGAWSIDGVYD